MEFGETLKMIMYTNSMGEVSNELRNEKMQITQEYVECDPIFVKLMHKD